MNRYRQFAAVALMLLGTAALVWAQAKPDIEEKFVRPGTYFVRALDTLCAAVADTTMGPSVYCFGARKVIWRIEANSGTCSTFTVQVSNNDTNYIAAPRLQVSVLNDFTVGDSLNQGGHIVTVIPVDSTRTATAPAFPYRFQRVFARQRTGYTTGTASAGPTVACRTRADSLRWKAAIIWSAP